MINIRNNRHSLYWDDFERRIDETVYCLNAGVPIPVRRVAVFITEKCNFKCEYCNAPNGKGRMSQATFENVLRKYGRDAILHITGGDPSTVKWLYPLLNKLDDSYRIHLNTNAYIKPPAKAVKRLKVSLDSHNPREWDCLVGRDGAFARVCENIKAASRDTVTSITFTLTKQSYVNAVDFIKFANQAFPDLYAIFFSVYKGSNDKFAFDNNDVNEFFNSVLPKMRASLHPESLALLDETIDEKRRLIRGVRFENNLDLSEPCYLSLSERVIAPSGEEFTCSHLYRDGVFMQEAKKHDKCRYGCNQRLVMFNEQVSQSI